jgi:hypothetical protein
MNDARLGVRLNTINDNQVLLKPFWPPYYSSMRDAVRAFLQVKFGEKGAYGGGTQQSAWRGANSFASKMPVPGDATIEAAIDFCEYVFSRYGRFPAYTAPFRTIIGFQVGHVDVDFYDRFYNTDALPETVRATTQRALQK